MNKQTQLSVCRLGLSLLEVIIASSIMFTLIAALLSAWSSTVDITYMENENLKRVETVDKIQSSLLADFQKSAAFIPYDSDTRRGKSSGVEFPAIRQNGREVRFLHLSNSSLSQSDPTAESKFTSQLAKTDGVALSQSTNASASPYFICNPAVDEFEFWNISPVWETNLNNKTQGGLNFAENSNSDYLRIYRYILVPYSNGVPLTLSDDTVYSTSDYLPYDATGDPLLRRGMLLRQYRNALDGSGPVWRTIGIPLSDRCVFYGSNVENNTCFFFCSAFDGVTRTGANVVKINEVQLKFTLAFNADKIAGHMKKIDYRLSFPFQTVNYGE